MLSGLPSHQDLQPCIPSLTPLGPTLVRTLTSRTPSSFPLNYQIPVNLPVKLVLMERWTGRTLLFSLVSYVWGTISPLLPEAMNNILLCSILSYRLWLTRPLVAGPVNPPPRHHHPSSDGSAVKNPLTMQGMGMPREKQVWFVGWEYPLEKEIATHSGILACEIPWTEESGGLLHGVAKNWIRFHGITKNWIRLRNHTCFSAFHWVI